MRSRRMKSQHIERRYVSFNPPERGDENPEALLRGTLVRFGDRATIAGFTEEFLPGSIPTLPTDVILNRQHERLFPLARTPETLKLERTDEGIYVEADLSRTAAARQAYEDVQAGLLSGLSIEFRCLKDEWSGTHRRIKHAVVTDIGLVDRPAYPDSEISKRAGLPSEKAIPWDLLF